MNLKSLVVEIDETMHNQVNLDLDEAKQGQKFKLPKQDNPSIQHLEGKEFFVHDIDQGPGSPDTVVYKIRSCP